MANNVQEEINKEVAENKILIYGKGTKMMPMCGFTQETIVFLTSMDTPLKWLMS